MTTPTSPTPEQGIPEDDYEGMTPEKLHWHMECIRFMMAYYGHRKTYIECLEKDEGATAFGETWVKEFSIVPGSDQNLRRHNFEIIDWLYEKRMRPDFIEKIRTFLFTQKKKTDEQGTGKAGS